MRFECPDCGQSYDDFICHVDNCKLKNIEPKLPVLRMVDKKDVKLVLQVLTYYSSAEQQPSLSQVKQFLDMPENRVYRIIRTFVDKGIIIGAFQARWHLNADYLLEPTAHQKDILDELSSLLKSVTAAKKKLVASEP